MPQRAAATLMGPALEITIKLLRSTSLWKAANPKHRRWISRRLYAMAGWSASLNSACMAPR
ncbi:hypothetical protein EMIT0P218_80178 [Pseudomonas sp. IT-P218]